MPKDMKETVREGGSRVIGEKEKQKESTRASIGGNQKGGKKNADS